MQYEILQPSTAMPGATFGANGVNVPCVMVICTVNPSCPPLGNILCSCPPQVWNCLMCAPNRNCVGGPSECPGPVPWSNDQTEYY